MFISYILDYKIVFYQGWSTVIGYFRFPCGWKKYIHFNISYFRWMDETYRLTYHIEENQQPSLSYSQLRIAGRHPKDLSRYYPNEPQCLTPHSAKSRNIQTQRQCWRSNTKSKSFIWVKKLRWLTEATFAFGSSFSSQTTIKLYGR